MEYKDYRFANRMTDIQLNISLNEIKFVVDLNLDIACGLSQSKEPETRPYKL